MPTPHPAKFSAEILAVIDDLPCLWAGQRVLDPFAGVGRVHQLRERGIETWGVELEPEWASQSPFTLVGDALKLPFPDSSFDAVITSPAYGNRMADKHNARDGSKRYTYRHMLGRPLTGQTLPPLSPHNPHNPLPRNAGGMQWGKEYRLFHQLAWLEVRRVLIPSGYLILNISDHVRKGRRQDVAGWHESYLTRELRFRVMHERKVVTKRMRNGEHSSTRVPHEWVTVFRSSPLLSLPSIEYIA